MKIFKTSMKRALSILLIAIFLFGVVVPVQAAGLNLPNRYQDFNKLLDDINKVLSRSMSQEDIEELTQLRGTLLQESKIEGIIARLDQAGLVDKLEDVLNANITVDQAKFIIKLLTAFGGDDDSLDAIKAEYESLRSSFDALLVQLSAKNISPETLYSFLVDLDKELAKLLKKSGADKELVLIEAVLVVVQAKAEYQGLEDIILETITTSSVGTALETIGIDIRDEIANPAEFIEKWGSALKAFLDTQLNKLGADFVSLYTAVKDVFFTIYKEPNTGGGGGSGGGGGGGGGSDTPRGPKGPELFDPKKPPIFAPLSELEVFPVDLSKDSIIKFGKALSLKVPEGAFNLPEGAKAEIYLQELDPKDLREQLEEKHKDAKNLGILGPILNIEFVTQVDGQLQKVTKFSKPITLELDLSNVDLEKVNPKKVGFWRIDDTGKVTGVGGKLDKEKKVFTVTRTSFSTYAILEYNKSFKDMEKHWGKNAIEELAAKGIITGVNESEFDPKTAVTRAQFVTMLVRGLGLEAEAESSFKDVKQSAWYYNAVSIASTYGLVGGYEDQTFKPNQVITREEMAAMLAKAMKFLGREIAVNTDAELVKYDDTEDIKAWAKDSVAIVSKQGLMAGQTAKSFVPKAKASRAEAAVVIHRLWSAQ